jgi:hypothetical protein
LTSQSEVEKLFYQLSRLLIKVKNADTDSFNQEAETILQRHVNVQVEKNFHVVEVGLGDLSLILGERKIPGSLSFPSEFERLETLVNKLDSILPKKKTILVDSPSESKTIGMEKMTKLTEKSSSAKLDFLEERSDRSPLKKDHGQEKKQYGQLFEEYWATINKVKKTLYVIRNISFALIAFQEKEKYNS